MSEDPRDQALLQELATARIMMEAPGRRVIVVAVAVDEHEIATLARAVSDGCKVSDVQGFIWGLRSEADRLEARIKR